MSRLIAVAALCLLWFSAMSCEKVPLLAPTDSTVTVSVNSTSVAVNGTATVTAFVVEAGGTAPNNGTQVTFVTDLGSVDPVDALTQNGRATATFRAGSRAGTAKIKALSGAAESDEISVTVGGGGSETGRVDLRIESSSAGGTVYGIVATVLDGGGNRLAGSPVSFSATNGAIISPGFVNADGNGEARTTVTMPSSNGTTVTARSGAAEAGTLEITAPGSLAITVTNPAAGTAAEVGAPVTFTIEPSNAIFNDVTVDFGDGPPQSIGSVAATRTITHTYTQRGNYTVTARGTLASGAQSVSSTSITVTDRAPLSVGLSALPNPVSLASAQGLTVLTATATGTAGAAITIARVEWSFGDGTPGQGTSLSINHRYAATGTFTATVRVVATDGREGTAATTVRVTP